MKGNTEKAKLIYEQGLKKFGPCREAIKDLYEAVQEGHQAEQARTILKEIFHYEGVI